METSTKGFSDKELLAQEVSEQSINEFFSAKVLLQ